MILRVLEVGNKAAALDFHVCFVKSPRHYRKKSAYGFMTLLESIKNVHRTDSQFILSNRAERTLISLIIAPKEIRLLSPSKEFVGLAPG